MAPTSACLVPPPPPPLPPPPTLLAPSPPPAAAAAAADAVVVPGLGPVPSSALASVIEAGRFSRVSRTRGPRPALGLAEFVRSGGWIHQHFQQQQVDPATFRTYLSNLDLAEEEEERAVGSVFVWGRAGVQVWLGWPDEEAVEEERRREEEEDWAMDQSFVTEEGESLVGEGEEGEEEDEEEEEDKGEEDEDGEEEEEEEEREEARQATPPVPVPEPTRPAPPIPRRRRRDFLRRRLAAVRAAVAPAAEGSEGAGRRRWLAGLFRPKKN